MIERIEKELRRIGEEISRLAKRVVELAVESLEIERRAARRKPEPDTVQGLLRERERIWKLEDDARKAWAVGRADRDGTRGAGGQQCTRGARREAALVGTARGTSSKNPNSNASRGAKVAG